MPKPLDTKSCYGTGTAISGFIKYVKSKLASMLKNRNHVQLSVPVEVFEDDPLGDLPKGWEMRLIRNQGGIYFAHLDSKTTQWEDPRTHGREDPLPPGWIIKNTGGDTPIFIDQNTNTTTCIDPRDEYNAEPECIFKPVPRCLKLKWKLAEFHSLCECNKEPSTIKITVRKERIVKDSFFQIMKIPPHQLRGKLLVKFKGEEGLNNEDVANDWFYLLSSEVFNPKFGLFKYADKYERSVEFNPESAADRNNLVYFRFIGRFIAMALFHGKIVHKHFTIPFYKCLSGKNLVLKDMEPIDSEFYNSLLWMMKNNIEEYGLELFFRVNYKIRGRICSYDLEPGGKRIKVNEENKDEFIGLMTNWRLSRDKKDQIESFVRGFNEVFPSVWLYYFDELELESMLCGPPELFDLKDWKEHTIYENCSKLHKEWFWEFVNKLDYEKQAALLQFVTGTREVPVGGFADLMGSYGPQCFCIQIVGDERELPKSQTCFNRLELPPYMNYPLFEWKMIEVIRQTIGIRIGRGRNKYPIIRYNKLANNQARQ